MKRKFVRKDEQIKLIMECRQSGLSDYQWCRQMDINPGTFYNWVSKLRKSGYTFPDLFFASTFWRKLQNIFGGSCISKLAKVAKHWPTVFRLAG